MPFAAALSTVAPTRQAIEEVCTQVRTRLAGNADLAVLFFSTHHARSADELARTVWDHLSPGCLLGCVAESVVANDWEIEQSPAVSLWASRWAGPVTMEPFHLVLERTADGPLVLDRVLRH
jgi:small ligand-binding sensory domain FIST